MKHLMMILPLLVTAVPAAANDMVGRLLEQYRAAGAGPFEAARGERLWGTGFEVKGKQRACTTCHNADLRTPGRHASTGKPIEPLAPSVNPQRLTEEPEVRKWLLRNCKWTLGRECSPQEKGDLLTFIRKQ